MRISCPQCAADYELPETLFLTGARKVRCVKCGHAWMAGAQAPAPDAAGPAPAAAAAPAAEAQAEQAPARRPLPLRRRPAAEPPVPQPELAFAPPEPPRSGAGLVVAWVVSLLLLAGGGWAGWEYRDQVVAAWPASAHLYQALGGN
jgi:predicted Zn finger-like uncharacterized protein